ncbi:MAG: hypothetical protein H6704_15490 [Myxococcales bacterium]|nr:hypothetical protein [Myxococcales bacterium]
MRWAQWGGLLLVGCAGARGAPGSGPTSAPSSAPAAIVELVGVAQNAKLGAVVTGTAHGDVYCRGVDAWPADLVGVEVRVRGRLQTTDAFAARVDADGAVSQGTAGGDVVLLECSYARAAPR